MGNSESIDDVREAVAPPRHPEEVEPDEVRLLLARLERLEELEETVARIEARVAELSDRGTGTRPER